MISDKDIWKAIYDLWFLLENRVNSEDDYQEYFENNPIAFSMFSIDHAQPFDKRSPHSLPYDPDRECTPEPDFIGVNRSTGVLSIVELKTPFVGSITTSLKLGQRMKFKASAESYISQANEYVDSIRGHKEARDVISKVFGIDRVSDYKIVIPYALAGENDVQTVAQLCSKKESHIEVVFYDELLERLIDRYFSSRRDRETRLGVTLVFHIDIPQKQAYERAYIGSYGAGERDRVSLFLENNCLYFQCIDSSGFTHNLYAPLTKAGLHFVRFEFSNDEKGIYMSLNIDNIEQDLRMGDGVLNLDLNLSNFVLGADANGQNGAAFCLLEHYASASTMELLHKLGSYDYFLRNTQGDELSAMEFKPESFMIRNPEGNMSQEEERFKPRNIKWSPSE